jgi:hypothetical protein
MPPKRRSARISRFITEPAGHGAYAVGSRSLFLSRDIFQRVGRFLSMATQRTVLVEGDHVLGSDLLAEARQLRHRYDLLRAAKTSEPGPTRIARLRELERVCERAAARLRWAQQRRRRQSRD